MIARYNTLTATYAELEQDWLKLAAKLGMLPPSSSPTS
jgi:hypothetical protein